MHNARVGLYDTGAATHVGNVRQRNEDSYLARPEAGIWAVADGMGGHESGDLASHTVIAALQSIEMPKSSADFLSRFLDGGFTANCRSKDIVIVCWFSVLCASWSVLSVSDGYYAYE